MGSEYDGFANSDESKPLFSFGVIADVQYADIPDGHSVYGVPRFYRHSMAVLERAVDNWNHHGTHKFILNFGDIVDGFCPPDQSLKSVTKAVKTFEKFNGQTHHMIGNHCLYNLSRDKLIPLMKIPGVDGQAYYEFSPTPEFRFVILDGFDISAIGWPQGHPKTQKAINFLNSKNHNSNQNSPVGLTGLDKRFVKFNGAVGTEQMEWFNHVLMDATKLRQKVVVCCHVPLDSGAADVESLLWNYNEVMDVVYKYKCVKVCLSGHDHKGGYSIDYRGIHHRSLEAALECPPGSNAFGYIDVYANKLSLVGTDRMQSTDMYFDNVIDTYCSL